MQQFLAFAVASVVLFSAGLIAGQGVNQADDTRLPSAAVTTTAPVTSIAGGTGNSGTASSEADADSNKNQTQDEPLAKPMPSPIMNASHHHLEEVTDRYFFSSVDDTADSAQSREGSTEQTTDAVAAPVAGANPEARRRLESLIQRMFPDASVVAVSAWADAYADMDLEEVEFILEQKRAMSGSLDSEIATAMLGTPLSAVSAETLLSTVGISPIVEAQNAVRMNLQCAWSSGYRRTVVIPEAVGSQNITVNAQSNPRRVTMFRSFEVGRIQPSPVPTHVAIASKNGSLMFALEGHTYTRRGDFQRLADGRLGLVTSAGQYALRDSTPIPESATSVTITPLGEIMYSADGQLASAGHVGIVELSELNRLQTVDGVFFTGETPSESPVTAVSAELTIHQLEMSNVNRSDDTELLELLSTELP